MRRRGLQPRRGNRLRYAGAKGLALALGLLAAACTPTPAPPATVHWKIIGPGGGGSQYHPTVSPHDPREVLVGCDMTGSYITRDAGASWRMFNLGLPARFFLFDPVDPRVIYVGTDGLWRSRDDGQSWRLVYPDPATVTGVVMEGDHARRRILSHRPYGTIVALAVDPADSAALYAVIRSEGKARLYLSTDHGAHWTPSHPLPAGTRRLYVDPASPPRNRTLYGLGTRGVAWRRDGKWRRGPLPPGVAGFRDFSLGFPAAGGDPVVYAITPRAAYVSPNGGQSWRESRFPGTSVRFQAIATSLHYPRVAYLSYNRLRLAGGPYLGVAKTEDRGKSWVLCWKDSPRTPGPNVHDNWLSERFGPGWGSNPFNLGVAPNEPRICYGTDYGRTMRTLDGGKSWEGVYSRREPDGSWTTTGLNVTTCYGVHFDPFATNRIFITYTDIGLFASSNGGRSWTSATRGVPRDWVNTTYWIVFDPAVKGRVWGVVSGTHDLPRPKMWRHRSPSTYTGGVVYSEDGGRHWRVSSRGMPPTAATHILLDPSSPVDHRVLYVAGFGRGVFKSVDGGRSWTLNNHGIEGSEPLAWRLARDATGTLYLVVARRSNDGSIGNAGDGALYRSTDGAENWTRLRLPPGVNGPNGLAIDPQDPQRLYLAAWARSTPRGPVGGGIFLSTDGGRSWRNVLHRDQHIYDVTIDPRNPNGLYATGFESSAWRSADRGETWKRIRGYNFKWGHRVIPDPHHPGMIYVTTFGGSVWYGPAAGDPQALEDIATPQLAYSR